MTASFDSLGTQQMVEQRLCQELEEEPVVVVGDSPVVVEETLQDTSAQPGNPTSAAEAARQKADQARKAEDERNGGEAELAKKLRNDAEEAKALSHGRLTKKQRDRSNLRALLYTRKAPNHHTGYADTSVRSEALVVQGWPRYLTYELDAARPTLTLPDVGVMLERRTTPRYHQMVPRDLADDEIDAIRAWYDAAVARQREQLGAELAHVQDNVMRQQAGNHEEVIDRLHGITDRLDQIMPPAKRRQVAKNPIDKEAFVEAGADEPAAYYLPEGAAVPVAAPQGSAPAGSRRFHRVLVEKAEVGDVLSFMNLLSGAWGRLPWEAFTWAPHHLHREVRLKPAEKLPSREKAGAASKRDAGFTGHIVGEPHVLKETPRDVFRVRLQAPEESLEARTVQVQRRQFDFLAGAGERGDGAPPSTKVLCERFGQHEPVQDGSLCENCVPSSSGALGSCAGGVATDQLVATELQPALERKGRQKEKQPRAARKRCSGPLVVPSLQQLRDGRSQCFLLIPYCSSCACFVYVA